MIQNRILFDFKIVQIIEGLSQALRLLVILPCIANEWKKNGRNQLKNASLYLSRISAHLNGIFSPVFVLDSVTEAPLLRKTASVCEWPLLLLPMWPSEADRNPMLVFVNEKGLKTEKQLSSRRKCFVTPLWEWIVPWHYF